MPENRLCDLTTRAETTLCEAIESASIIENVITGYLDAISGADGAVMSAVKQARQQADKS